MPNSPAGASRWTRLRSAEPQPSGHGSIDGPRHAALLLAAVLLVTVAVQTSDIATVRWREIDGLPGFEYPIVVRALFVVERWVASSRTGIAVVNAAVGVAAAVTVTLLLLRSRADVRIWAHAPSLVLVAVNVDAVVALVVLLTWQALQDGCLEKAGFWAGAGAAFKVAPGLLLLPAMTVAGWWRGAKIAAIAGLVWLVVNLPYALTRPDEWAFPYRFARLRGDIKGSVWAPLSLALETVNRASAALVVGLAALITVALARKLISPGGGALLLLLAFMVGNKLWQPQYVLWLLPIAAVMHIPVRPLRTLELANLAYFLVIWRQLDPAAEAPWLWLTAAGRLAAAVWVAVVVVRRDLEERRRSTQPVAA